MGRIPSVNIIAVCAAIVLAGAVLPAESSPQAFRAVTNYPNPFDSRQETTTICFQVPTEARVTVRIYDLFGNLVREYPVRFASAGTNTVVWDGTDNGGEKVAKGGYVCLITAEHETSQLQLLATRKIGVIH
jgi:flagellar hook assembly protein FlgD